MTDKWIIRTSDRIQFKRCRQAWDWGSKLRGNLEVDVEDQALRFGIAIHAAMEAWYDPKLWDGDRLVAAKLASLAFLNNYTCPWENPDPVQLSEYKDQVELGLAMIEHYIKWSPEIDKGITPLYTEVEFEVPILVPQGAELPEGFTEVVGYLQYNGLPVVYQGRLDLIYQDRSGQQVIRDFKTTSRMDEVDDWLPYDEQLGSYPWAISHELGIRIDAVEWVQMLKDTPKPPRILKNGSLSQDKSQNTTHELYLTTVRDLGYNVAEYADILEYFRSQGNKFFRRTQIRKTPTELANQGGRIGVEAIDMLNDPFIYPNPSIMHCRRCQFKAPCLAKLEGSDHEWLLSERFRVRD